MAKMQFSATGRRKCSVARVRLVPGSGNITVNGKSLSDYLARRILEIVVNAPLVVTETTDKYDVLVNVYGGGTTGQAGAIRHGIARALIVAQPELRPVLKKNGFLTRDPRMKERRKYGLKKARKTSKVNLSVSSVVL